MHQTVTTADRVDNMFQNSLTLIKMLQEVSIDETYKRSLESRLATNLNNWMTFARGAGIKCPEFDIAGISNGVYNPDMANVQILAAQREARGNAGLYSP